MNIDYFRPFSDWLSISHANSTTPVTELISLLNSVSPFDYIDLNQGAELYKNLHGTVKVTRTKTATNISISGGVLRLLRDNYLMNDVVMILGSSPYNITRLDAAIDIPIAGYITLSNIRALYPTGETTISSRPRSLQYVLQPLDSKTDTGTCYFQTRKYGGHIKLRVYDKAFEVLTSTALTIDPTTRYELTVARGASLRDFINPSHVLFHYLPTELLKPPTGVTILPWKPTERVSYDNDLMISITDYEKYKSVVESSPALQSLIDESIGVRGATDFLIRFIRERVTQYGVNPVIGVNHVTSDNDVNHVN